jgi:hypothetical protein
MPRNQVPQLTAGGNVLGRRFVKLSTATDRQGLQATANDKIIGISWVQEKDNRADVGNTYVAQAGDELPMLGLGDIGYLQIGSTVTRGDHLVSDSNGKGITIASSGAQQNVGAIALESANTDEFALVQVVILNELIAGSTGSITATDITGTDSSLDIKGQVGSSSVGGAIPIVGGAGNGAFAGGAVSLTGGASGAGATGNGGASSVTGGAAASTNGNGGAVPIAAGAATGTGSGGAVTIAGGASGGASGTAGAVSIDTGAATGGTGAPIDIGSVNATAVYLARGPLKSVIFGQTVTSIGTSQNSTPTAAQLLGGVVTQTGATGAGTVTTPTGTVLSAAMPKTPATGDAFGVLFCNLGGSETLTITAGASGMTVVGTAAVGSGKNANLTFVCTGTNTWNCYVVVSA